MEPSVYGLILLIIIILIGSACCSGVEAAFLAVNSIRILEIASRQKPKSSANQLLKLRKHLGRTLTVITITNNGFNIIGSLILGVYGALVINSSFGLTFFSIAFYILVVLVGEVLPKALGTRFSIQIALLSVPILRILNTLMRPFLILIEQIFPVITAENEISTDEEEIRQMAKIGSQKGFIEADEAAMIFKVFSSNESIFKLLIVINFGFVLISIFFLASLYSRTPLIFLAEYIGVLCSNCPKNLISQSIKLCSVISQTSFSSTMLPVKSIESVFSPNLIIPS